MIAVCVCTGVDINRYIDACVEYIYVYDYACMGRVLSLVLVRVFDRDLYSARLLAAVGVCAGRLLRNTRAMRQHPRA